MMCLIGHPVSQSPGQIIYNQFFRNNGINSTYISIDIHPTQFDHIMKGIVSTFTGINVTIPFKKRVIEYANVVDQVCEVTGTANILKRNEDSIMCYNSDYHGFVNSVLSKYDGRIEKAMVYGSGGTARTTVHALQDRFHCDLIYLITRHRIWVDRWFIERGVEVMEYGKIESLRDIDAVINCTPVGMFSGMPGSLVVPVHHSGRLLAVDYVYSKDRTEFLKMAESQGAITVSGSSIFVFQAVENLRIWFGMDVSSAEMEKYFDEAMRLISNG